VDRRDIEARIDHQQGEACAAFRHQTPQQVKHNQGSPTLVNRHFVFGDFSAR